MNHEDTADAERRTITNFGIRKGQPGDEQLLCDLAGALQQGHLEARPDFFKPHVVTPEMIAEYMEQLRDENTYVYIGEVDKKPIGYILAKVMKRPESSYTYGLEFLYIGEMSVSPQHRSAGYGERLMQHIFDLAYSLRIETVILNVWAFNERAIAFYKRQGFTIRDYRMEAKVELPNRLNHDDLKDIE